MTLRNAKVVWKVPLVVHLRNGNAVIATYKTWSPYPIVRRSFSYLWAPGPGVYIWLLILHRLFICQASSVVGLNLYSVQKDKAFKLTFFRDAILSTFSPVWRHLTQHTYCTCHAFKWHWFWTLESCAVTVTTDSKHKLHTGGVTSNLLVHDAIPTLLLTVHWCTWCIYGSSPCKL